MTMASGFYGVTLEAIFEGGSHNLLTDSHKMALVLDAYTPNFDTHDFYADITNEVVGTGYTVGGNVLDTVTSAIASGFYKFSSAAEAWAAATFTARGSVIYDDTIASDPLLVSITFGADFTATAGTFTVTPHANGWFRYKYNPAA